MVEKGNKTNKTNKMERREMICPYCGKSDNEVVETRESEDGKVTRRRRRCNKCKKRFTTYERVESLSLVVRKKNGTREPFDSEKLKKGIVKACEKTTVSLEEMEKLTEKIGRQLRGLKSMEVKSEKIGRIAAKELKKLNKVAYIRFASVFQQFMDLEDFEKEMEKLL